MKAFRFFTHFFTVSGAAGANNVIVMPTGGIVRGIDIACGFSASEGGPANLLFHALMFRGSAPDITAPTNDVEYEGAVAGVAQQIRSNATFGTAVSANKFVPLSLPIKAGEIWQLAYRISAGANAYAFFTFHIEL